MKAFTLIAILFFLCCVQVFAQDTCSGVNDAAIFHVLDVCDNPNGISREFKWYMAQNGSTTVVAVDTFSPPSNCSSHTKTGTDYYPLDKCIPNDGVSSNTIIFSTPAPGFVLPYTNAFMVVGYNGCPDKSEMPNYNSERVWNPKFCMKFSDGTSSTTDCDEKNYYINYFDSADCTGTPDKAPRGYGCTLGDYESCYFGANSDPTKKYVLVNSYYPSDYTMEKRSFATEKSVYNKVLGR